MKTKLRDAALVIFAFVVTFTDVVTTLVSNLNFWGLGLAILALLLRFSTEIDAWINSLFQQDEDADDQYRGDW